MEKLHRLFLFAFPQIIRKEVRNLARGKKTSPETIYTIMASWMTTGNYKETARDLNLAVSTVRDIVMAHKDDEQFVNLRNEKMKEFSNRAAELIQKGLVLLNRRFDRALESEYDLDVLIDEIFQSDKSELSQDEKNRLVAKVRSLQLHDIKAITTALATLYDKRALADGHPTERTEIIGGDIINKLAELAGYERKQ